MKVSLGNYLIVMQFNKVIQSRRAFIDNFCFPATTFKHFNPILPHPKIDRPKTTLRPGEPWLRVERFPVSESFISK